MNLDKYLELKKARKQQFENLPRRMSCSDCLRPTSSCFCKFITPTQTSSKLIILMHPKEHRKIKINTGRLTHLSFPNSEIIIGESFENNQYLNNIISCENNEVYLLYPGENSHNISKSPLEVDNEKQKIFLIIDGTWPHAKSMMKKSVNLHRLKRVSFNVENVSRFSIKHQPAKYCLSTLESTYLLLKNLHQFDQENEIPASTLEVLDQIVQYQIDCSQDESKASYRPGKFKSTRERKVSKKHIKRSICFKETP